MSSPRESVLVESSVFQTLYTQVTKSGEANVRASTCLRIEITRLDVLSMWSSVGCGWIILTGPYCAHGEQLFVPHC